MSQKQSISQGTSPKSGEKVNRTRRQLLIGASTLPAFLTARAAFAQVDLRRVSGPRFSAVLVGSVNTVTGESGSLVKEAKLYEYLKGSPDPEVLAAYQEWLVDYELKVSGYSTKLEGYTAALNAANAYYENTGVKGEVDVPATNSDLPEIAFKRTLDELGGSNPGVHGVYDDTYTDYSSSYITWNSTS